MYYSMVYVNDYNILTVQYNYNTVYYTKYYKNNLSKSYFFTQINQNGVNQWKNHTISVNKV